MPAPRAARKLAPGPAAAIHSPSRSGSRRFRSSTGTGFAQPNPAKITMSVPSGSRCRSGFKVIRPRSRAVGSPKRSAIQACAISWQESAKSITGMRSAR